MVDTTPQADAASRSGADMAFNQDPSGPADDARVRDSRSVPYFARQRQALPTFIGGARPEPETARRKAVIRGAALLTVVVTLGYLTWRVTSTIDLGVWWVAIPLFLAELHNGIGMALYTLSLWDIDAGPEFRSVDAPPGRVAVLIPTYHEPEEVLLPAIAGALAIEIPHETWVLDDGNRPEIRELAEDLGANYLAREENTHAKAGNLNNAIRLIPADFYAVFDADHVAQPDFLRHTMGYFDDPRVALVQTPQDFYNLESFEHEGVTQDDQRPYNEESIFYRVIAPGKNFWNAAFWCGTGAVVRATALREVGLVATESVTEDIQTSMRMNRHGWRCVYHNEVLARGLAPSDATSYMLQRHRWAIGAMQVLRQERPITNSHMTLGQRMAFATTLLGWFDSWRTFAFITLPIGVIITGASPISAPGWIYGPAFVVTFVSQFVSLRLLARGFYPPVASLLFEMLRLPAVLPATLVLLTGERARFIVTPKGASAERNRTPVPWLHRVLLASCAVALVWLPATLLGLTPTVYHELAAVFGSALFLVLNFALLVMAARRIRDPRFAANRRASVRFEVRLFGSFDGKRCEVEDLSATGAQVLVIDGDPAAVPGHALLDIVLPDGAVAAIRCDVKRQLERTDGLELGLEFAPGQREAAAVIALALLHPHETPEELGAAFPVAA